MFVGETWNGSSARSLRDALAAIDGIEMDDLGEDHYRPRARGLPVRALNRLLTPLYRRELGAEILQRLAFFKPQVVVVYKGGLISIETVRSIRRSGVPVVNVFPDCSPHAHGDSLRAAIAEYDLVISAKPFHPGHWHKTYGYSNRCVCVPHGYDPRVHYWETAHEQQDIDVVLAASWRPEYERLLAEVGVLMPDSGVSVALAGPGWGERRQAFPSHWDFPGALYGRAYGEFLRRGKIVIAPVQTEMIVDGIQQPGEVDTTRTYELAAAGTFFLHRRTPYVGTVYEEGVESDFWDDPRELVAKIRHYLPRAEDRKRMALAAHQRAVPAYSIPSRAREIVVYLDAFITKSGGADA